MKSTLSIFAVAFVFFMHNANAFETAVFLPVTGPLTPNEKVELTKEAVEGLSSRFVLKHGEEVDRVVKQAFLDESKKQDCDETNCYRHIASKYQAEKIIALRVSALGAGHYLATLQIYDVPTGEVFFSRKSECKACSFEILKGLSRDLVKHVPVSP